MTLHEIVEHGRARLQRAGIPPAEARLDAEVLARHVLGWDRATLFARRLDPAPEEFTSRYDDVIRRRERREPVTGITGVREFWGLDFEVTPAVLAPRPETEFIVEEAIAAFAGRPAPAEVIDVGTGTGCIAVVLARVFAAARVLAVDVSRDALDVARRNAVRHGVAHRIGFLQSDLLTAVRGPADLIASNPPYVPLPSAPELPPEVRDHEPAVALFGGKDGLDPWRRLVAQAGPRTRPGGLLVAEFGFGQEPALRELLDQDPAWTVRRVRRDLQGIPRVLVAQRTRPDCGETHAQ